MNNEIIESRKRQESLFQSENVYIVNTENVIIGTQTKAESHGPDGKLHRALSVLIFDDEGKMLLQRRSEHKITFPNLLSNAVCTHPLANYPEERDADTGTAKAAVRRLKEELGFIILPEKLKLIGKLLYRAEYIPNKLYEHELDNIYVCNIADFTEADFANVNKDEVGELVWCTMEECKENGKLWSQLSPWFKKILREFILGLWPQIEKDGWTQGSAALVKNVHTVNTLS